MSVNNPFRQRCKDILNCHIYKIKNNDNDLYWDEGIKFYPRYKLGFKNPNKQIMSYQVRMYRTWKYNRKNQWK